MNMFLRRLVYVIAGCFSIAPLAAQQVFFKDVQEASIQRADQVRAIIPQKYRTVQLDTAALLTFLSQVPQEASILNNRNAAPILTLPMPDGTSAKFYIWESSAMAPELAKGFPEIRTFTGQGIDDRTATIKLDFTEFGFHAMIYSSLTGNIFIDPYDQRTMVNYISYYRKDYINQQEYKEGEPIHFLNESGQRESSPADIQAGTCVGTQLRTYRLAIACTNQYAKAATGLANPTKAQALARIVTTVNRVNGVYEKDLAIRLVLIPNDTAIIFVTTASDPFTGNSSPNVLIGESQTQITNRIGNANFDIGHTFSTGGGGLAGLGVVCRNGQKAAGITGTNNPKGDAYDIDYVAHEIGHQFGANHTFNSQLGSCGGNISTTTNSEPGSGVTIMAYAGICGGDNLAGNSIDLFHAVSYREIIAYTTTGAGSGCDVLTNLSNIIPVVDAGADYTIPDSTSFMLTGSATDANGDAITYTWEQMDVGGPSAAWNQPTDNAPLFRSFNAVANGVRHFPRLSDQVRNVRTIGEILPNYARNMNFRLTARDNRAGGGGICNDEMRVIVDSKGPFRVTYPNASGVTLTAGEFYTITWDPAGSALAPVNCANVSIQLSTDSGYTFPVTMLATTPNDGSQEVLIPNNISTTARIRVMAVGNIFYDISNVNFRIQAASTPGFSFSNPAPVALCTAASGSTTLNTGSLAGFTTNIVLTASQVPAGASISFGNNTLSPGNGTTVTLNNANSLAPGSYAVRITGTAGTVVKTRDIVFIVGTASATPVLNSPADSAYGVATTGPFNWAAIPAATYTFEISDTANFARITQTIDNFTSLPLVLPTPLEENKLYFWRVKSTSSCGPGAFSNVYRFKTANSSCKKSADVPKSVEQLSEGETSIITIPAENGITITDLNVIGIQGTFNSYNDVKLVLISPANTVAIIADALCAGNTASMDFNLDDQATSPIPCPPTGNVIVQPLNPLSVFNGENSAGTWRLIVVDNTLNGGVTLSGWGLNFNSTGTNCVDRSTPLAVSYTFTGNGNWTEPANWSSGAVPPSPLPSGATIIINHQAGGSCILNTTQRVSAGATLNVLTGKNLVIPGALTVQ